VQKALEAKKQQGPDSEQSLRQRIDQAKADIAKLEGTRHRAKADVFTQQKNIDTATETVEELKLKAASARAAVTEAEADVHHHKTKLQAL
jgi:chromosome segregation ATPase